MAEPKPAVELEEIEAQTAAPAAPKAGARDWQPSWIIATFSTWVAAVIVELLALLVIILDLALNEVVDWILQIWCICVLIFMLIRSAGCYLESLGMVSLGLMGIALHVSTAASGSALGGFAIFVYSVMMAVGIASLVTKIHNDRWGTWRDWALVVPPILEGLLKRCPCQENTRKCCKPGCYQCWQMFNGVLFLLCVLWFLAMSILFFSTEDLAAVGTYDPALLVPAAAAAAGRIPPMQVGTADNINLGPIPIDLTGVWWIRWNRGEPLPLYGVYHLEETVSFAGTYLRDNINMTAGASVPYPVRASSPTGEEYRWGFSNSVVGRVAMMVVAKTKNPFSTLNFRVDSPTEIFIYGGGETPWTMEKLNEDEWLRRIEIEGHRDLFYTLTRIVYGNGTAHPEYFDAFTRHMGGTKLRVWTTNSRTCRECGSVPAGTQSACSDVCVAPAA